MAARRIDVAYITRPVSIAYLTGFHADPHERLMALVVRAAEATLIVPSLEEEKANAQASEANVVAWRDGEDPYELVARALAGNVELAVEKEHLSLHAAEVITSRSGASELVDVGSEIRRLRLAKNADEIEKLSRAAAITDDAFVRVLARMHGGMSEVDVAFLFGSVIGDLGAALAFNTLVQSGPNSAMPHLEPSSRKLARGDLVLLDFGAAWAGYKADSTRMAVVGEPSARQREIHAVVLRAHDAAIAAARPGVTTGDVDAAARRVIEDAGYGKEFFHRVGHGIGLEGHEDPSLDPGSRTVLEPGVYIPGWGGVRIEDDLVVTDDGCRVLTKADRSLHIVS